MKRYTTRFFKTVALFYIVFPISYVVFGAIIFDIPSNQIAELIFSKFFYLLSAIAIVAGYGLWEARRWAWYIFTAANLLILYSNAIVVTNLGATSHKTLSYLFSVICVLVAYFRVSREIRVPYFLPKIRWWENDPRYRLSTPVLVRRSDNSTVSGEIMDLSGSGCFVKLRDEISQHETIKMTFSIFGTDFESEGVVVWCTSGTVTHPKGIGIKFSPMQRRQRRIMRAVTQRLRKITALYRSSRYMMSKEEFARQLQVLQSTRLDVSLKQVVELNTEE